MKIRAIYYKLQNNDYFKEYGSEYTFDRELKAYDIFHEKEDKEKWKVYKIPFVEVGSRIGFLTNKCIILKKYKKVEELDKLEVSKKTLMKEASLMHLIPNEHLYKLLDFDTFLGEYCDCMDSKLELQFGDKSFNVVTMERQTITTVSGIEAFYYFKPFLDKENIFYYHEQPEYNKIHIIIPYINNIDYEGQILMFTKGEELDINNIKLHREDVSIARMIGTVIEPSVELVDAFHYMLNSFEYEGEND